MVESSASEKGPKVGKEKVKRKFGKEEVEIMRARVLKLLEVERSQEDIPDRGEESSPEGGEESSPTVDIVVSPVEIASSPRAPTSNSNISAGVPADLQGVWAEETISPITLPVGPSDGGAEVPEPKPYLAPLAKGRSSPRPKIRSSGGAMVGTTTPLTPTTPPVPGPLMSILAEEVPMTPPPTEVVAKVRPTFAAWVAKAVAEPAAETAAGMVAETAPTN